MAVIALSICLLSKWVRIKRQLVYETKVFLLMANTYPVAQQQFRYLCKKIEFHREQIPAHSIVLTPMLGGHS